MNRFLIAFLLFFSGLPLASGSNFYHVKTSYYDACGITSGWVGTIGAIKNACVGSERNGKKIKSITYASYKTCSQFGLVYNSGSESGVFFACKVTSCPKGTKLNEETGKCENPCEKLEGNSLGTVTFPVGSSQVNAVCNNSCKATLLSGSWISAGIQNDPRPFGHYNYSGDACDGSEGSGSVGSGGDGSGSGGDGSGSGGDGSGSGGSGSGSGGSGSGSGGSGSGSGGSGSGSGGSGSGSGGSGSGSGGSGSGSGGDGSGSGGDGSGSGGDGSGSGGDGSGSGGDGSGSGGDGSGSGGDGSGSGGSGSGSGGSGSGSGGSGSGSGGSGSGSGGSGSGSGGSGGGGSDGDGLTKGDIKDAIEEALGKSGTFTSPANGEGYGSGTALTGSVAALQTEVEELEDELKRKLKKSPLKLGQMSFSNGSYDGTSFNLSRWDVDVGFNLFSSLGVNNTDMIRTVILFIATLFAGFILLSSGRSKV